MKRRVVITGMGTVCPIGNTVNEAWENAKNGICGIAPISKYDASLANDPEEETGGAPSSPRIVEPSKRVTLAGEIKDLDTEKYLDPSESRKMDNFTIYAMCAAAQAYNDSGLADSDDDKRRWGVILSSGIGGIKTIEDEHDKGIKKGFDRISPYYIPKAISNMAAGHIAIKYGLHGMCGCAVSACASSANGIGDAFRHIRDGYGDVMFAGGSEASVTRLCMGGFAALKALSKSDDPKRASIPFDKDRNGFVMGEGAAILILEEYEHAVKRGARIYAELSGYGVTCDAHHITALNPEAEESARCIKEAVCDAGLTVNDIDYINAHGTSTKMNDECETKAIKKALGEHAYNIKISSTKSMTGHLLGASAALEAIITVKALQEGFIPPTAGLKEKDSECDLDYTPGEGMQKDIKFALSNSFGFGGHNVCLAFKKYENQ